MTGTERYQSCSCMSAAHRMMTWPVECTCAHFASRSLTVRLKRACCKVTLPHLPSRNRGGATRCLLQTRFPHSPDSAKAHNYKARVSRADLGISTASCMHLLRLIRAGHCDSGFNRGKFRSTCPRCISCIYCHREFHQHFHA